MFFSSSPGALTDVGTTISSCFTSVSTSATATACLSLLTASSLGGVGIIDGDGERGGGGGDRNTETGVVGGGPNVDLLEFSERVSGMAGAKRTLRESGGGGST